MTQPKYPEITVQLIGQDGNVFSIMGRVSEALRRGRVSHEDREAFRMEMMNSESYDEALCTVMRWVDFE